MNSDDQDSLNLYDVSGLAHYDLCRAIDHTGAIFSTAVTRADLVANLKDRLAGAEKRGGNEAFGLGSVIAKGTWFRTYWVWYWNAASLMNSPTATLMPILPANSWILSWALMRGELHLLSAPEPSSRFICSIKSQTCLDRWMEVYLFCWARRWKVQHMENRKWEMCPTVRGLRLGRSAKTRLRCFQEMAFISLTM